MGRYERLLLLRMASDSEVFSWHEQQVLKLRSGSDGCIYTQEEVKRIFGWGPARIRSLEKRALEWAVDTPPTTD